jgi:hypothetical protein
VFLRIFAIVVSGRNADRKMPRQNPPKLLWENASAKIPKAGTLKAKKTKTPPPKK